MMCRREVDGEALGSVQLNEVPESNGDYLSKRPDQGCYILPFLCRGLHPVSLEHLDTICLGMKPPTTCKNRPQVSVVTFLGPGNLGEHIWSVAPKKEGTIML